ncbi:hypothetical protein Tco_1324304, partial [Tanacetum coccineum]
QLLGNLLICTRMRRWCTNNQTRNLVLPGEPHLAPKSEEAEQRERPRDKIQMATHLFYSSERMQEDLAKDESHGQNVGGSVKLDFDLNKVLPSTALLWKKLNLKF